MNLRGSFEHNRGWFFYILLDQRAKPIPVVVTGREERVRELSQLYSGRLVIPLPLITTEYVGPSLQELDLLRRSWPDENASSGSYSLIAVFSVPGVRFLRQLCDAGKLQFPRALWAVTGDQTARAVDDLFPGATVRYVSPDNTGEGLAHLLLREVEEGIKVLAVSAWKGRVEFSEHLTTAGWDVTVLRLYRTKSRIPTTAEMESLPLECHIIFGSPSGVTTFFAYYAQREGKKTEPPTGFRYCALGKTTAAAITEAGYRVYTMAKKADYESFIADLLE